MVGRAHQRIELEIDFGLPARRDFMVMALDLQPAVLHGHNHLAAQVLVVIGWRHREIAFLVAGTIAEIVLDAAGIPAAFFGVDEIKAVLLTLIKADIIENKKLGFSAEISRISNASRTEVHLGLAGDVARITVIALLGDRIDDVAGHDQRGRLGKGVEHVGVGIGDEQHVALMDRCPAANRGAVHAKAFFERRFAQLLDGIGNMVPETGKVGETEVEQLDSVLFDKLQNCLGISH